MGQFQWVLLVGYFYPRSPCGERLDTVNNFGGNSYISIHALLAESDDFKRLGLLGWLNFYPRSPCGERLGSRIYDMSAA